ncbi:MAG: class I SAM-dependent methyltransferase family protein [Candidatus Altiarchaeota archaeon]|nr:class I SAM-dependent methyltransferase family protein [Candidatus Altiarchaeota archaeon]
MHLKVRERDGEKVRKKLIGLGILDKRRRILRDEGFLFIPILEEIDLPDAEIVWMEGGEIERKPFSLKESLKEKLTENELKIAPKSFDLIGDIAVLEIPEELKDKKEIIGNSLLKTFKNIKVVAAKKTTVGTEFRTRKVEVIAGEQRTETVHREYNCFYKLDVGSTYFSPRLGTERMRIAKQVRDDERVLVMFAGVGPYAILISKESNAKVYAIELNPRAFEYMTENIKLNNVDVIPIEGDVREETPRLGKFNSIVMPLPKDAGDFLDVALPTLEKNGVVHFYDFSHNEDESIEKVRKIGGDLGYTIQILDAVKCGSYSPGVFRICVDFKVI